MLTLDSIIVIPMINVEITEIIINLHSRATSFPDECHCMEKCSSVPPVIHIPYSLGAVSCQRVTGHL